MPDFHQMLKQDYRRWLTTVAILSLSYVLLQPTLREWAAMAVVALILAAAIYACRFPIARGVLARAGAGVQRLSKVPAGYYWGFLAFAFLLLTAYLSGALFEHLPRVPDSRSQYIGSKIFASGHWYLDNLPVPKAFNTLFIISNGKYYSLYPPGHMLLLAAGQLVGVPWLVNPLLGALFVVALYYLALEAGGMIAARIAAPLVLISPFIVLMSSEFMNHATALLCTTLFLLFYLKAVRLNSGRYALWCGLAAGFLFITRPQTAIVFGLPVAIHLLSQWRVRTLLIRRSAIGFAPFVLFFLFYNYITNGDPFLTGYRVSDPTKGNELFTFFLPSHWPFIPEDFIRTRQKTVWLDYLLFTWPVPSFLFIILLLLGKISAPLRLLLCCFLLLVFAQMLTPFTDSGFGPRYLYEASGVLLLFTALGIEKLWRWLAHVLGDAKAAAGCAAGLMLLLIIGSIPQYERALGRYDQEYWRQPLLLYHRLLAGVKPPALVLMRTPGGIYNAISFTLPPDPDAPIIFARALGGESNSQLIAYYQGRNVYRYDGVRIIPVEAAKQPK